MVKGNGQVMRRGLVTWLTRDVGSTPRQAGFVVGRKAICGKKREKKSEKDGYGFC